MDFLKSTESALGRIMCWAPRLPRLESFLPPLLNGLLNYPSCWDYRQKQWHTMRFLSLSDGWNARRQVSMVYPSLIWILLKRREQLIKTATYYSNSTISSMDFRNPMYLGGDDLSKKLAPCWSKHWGAKCVKWGSRTALKGFQTIADSDGLLGKEKWGRIIKVSEKKNVLATYVPIVSGLKCVVRGQVVESSALKLETA